MDYDSWLESPYQERYENDATWESLLEDAEKSYGKIIHEDDDLFIFEDGHWGYLELGKDEYGTCLEGIKEGKITDIGDYYLFKATELVPSKRKSPKPYRGYRKEVVKFFLKIPKE